MANPNSPAGTDGDDANGDVGRDGDGSEEEPDMEDLIEDLQELEETVESPEARRLVQETMRTAFRVSQPNVFGRVIRGYDRGDVAEALLGSVLFGIPMFVEGGTQEVGVFISTHPVYMAGTFAFAVGMVVGIIYVADIQDVRVYKPLFGVLPRRLVGVLAVAFVTAVAIMTAWGRVDWSAPWLALNQVVVAFAPMAIGAALGDILPGS